MKAAIEQDELTPLAELAAIVAEWASREPEIARVFLFASRVRGRTKDCGPVRPGFGPESSDLDVAIELVPDNRQQLLGGSSA
jgi:predicted nucleotidyltransferase